MGFRDQLQISIRSTVRCLVGALRFIYKKIHRSRNKVGPKIPLSFIAGRKSAWSRDKMGNFLENQRPETYLDPCNLDKIRLHQHSFPWYCGCAHCRGLRPHAQETTFSNPNRVCSRNSTFGAQRLPRLEHTHLCRQTIQPL